MAGRKMKVGASHLASWLRTNKAAHQSLEHLCRLQGGCVWGTHIRSSAHQSQASEIVTGVHGGLRPCNN